MMEPKFILNIPLEQADRIPRIQLILGKLQEAVRFEGAGRCTITSLEKAADNERDLLCLTLGDGVALKLFGPDAIQAVEFAAHGDLSIELRQPYKIVFHFPRRGA
jgi:hypothetical protein